MTITERNYCQTKLREQLLYYCRMADSCHEGIMHLERDYKEEDFDLHQQYLNAN
jgi:hypothetical protein